MFGQTWTHNILKKYVIVFGTLFNNIHITRSNPQGTSVQTLKVPLTYSPKDKILARLNQDPELENQVALTLPRMAFEITNYQYAPERKLNTSTRIYKQQDDGSGKFVYQPVPYDIIFNLYIMVKNAEDGTRIIEQILPYFTPEFTVTANILPDIDKSYDIPITLADTSVQDVYEGDFQTRRSLVWILTFSMKGYLFGPIRRSSLIHFANAGFIVTQTPQTESIDSPVSSYVTAQPGQLANGSPTSNLALTIPYNDVDPNGEYDFINQFVETFNE